jgi:hypothetical protein
VAGTTSGPPERLRPPCARRRRRAVLSETTPERGIDVDVAQARRQLGRPLKLVWVQVPNRGGLGKALRQTLRRQCDAYLGIPQGPTAPDLAERNSPSPYLCWVTLVAPGSTPPTRRRCAGARKSADHCDPPTSTCMHEVAAHPAGSAALMMRWRRARSIRRWSRRRSATPQRSWLPCARRADLYRVDGGDAKADGAVERLAAWRSMRGERRRSTRSRNATGCRIVRP